MAAIVTSTLVCLTGVLGVLPRGGELTPMQWAHVSLILLGLGVVNFAGYRMYNYIRLLTGAVPELGPGKPSLDA